MSGLEIMSSPLIEGKVWTFGDDVDTDAKLDIKLTRRFRSDHREHGLDTGFGFHPFGLVLGASVSAQININFKLHRPAEQAANITCQDDALLV